MINKKNSQLISNPISNQSTYRIIINGLTLSASIGIHPYELKQKQPLLIDMKVTVADNSSMTGNDDIRDVLDYDQLVACIDKVVASRHFNLLETLSTELLNTLAHFPIERIELRIAKPLAIVNAAQVAIERLFIRELAESTQKPME